MKFCRKCGASLDDNAQFCLECGEKSIDGFSQQDYSSVNLISKNGLIDSIRDCAKSTLFLVTLGVFLITTVVSFVISMYDASRNAINVTVNSNVVATDNGVTVAIISLIVSALVALGMILIHSSAKSGGEMKTAGLTIIKVISIITLVFLCFAVVILAITTGVLFSYGSNTQDFLKEFGGSDSFTILTRSWILALYQIAFAIATVIFAFLVVYYAFIIKTINCIKSTIQTGVVKGLGAAGFVGVTSIVIGALAAVGAIGIIGDGAMVVGLSSLLSAASIILFGVLLVNYRKRVIAYK